MPITRIPLLIITNNFNLTNGYSSWIGNLMAGLAVRLPAYSTTILVRSVVNLNAAQFVRLDPIANLRWLILRRRPKSFTITIVRLLLKAPEFFQQLVIEVRHKSRIHSIDSFVHWFKNRHPELRCPLTPTVNRYINEGQLELTNSELPMKLRRRVKSYHKAHQCMNKHVLGRSIEDRTSTASNRTELGHWKGDLVKGERVASEPAIMTLAERVRRYEIIVRIENYHAATFRQALHDVLDDHGPEYFKAVTFDNVSEFAKLSQVTGTTVFFAHPYSPWNQ